MKTVTIRMILMPLAGDCDGDGVPASEDCNDLDDIRAHQPAQTDVVPSLSSKKEDANGDGVLGSGDTIRDYVYNTDGLLESETRDDDADNTVNAPLPTPTIVPIKCHNG